MGIIPHRIECDRLVTNFMALPTLEDVLRNAAVKKDKEQIWKIWDMLLEQIEMTSDMADEKSPTNYGGCI